MDFRQHAYKFFLSLKYPNLRRSLNIFSHLTMQERGTLHQLACLFPLGNIVEIGSYLGASSCCFASSFDKKSDSGKVFCIDTWNNDSMTDGQQDTMEAFVINTKPFSSKIVPVRGYSTNVTDKIYDQVVNIDLLFIDGDHSYDGVKADWEAYKVFLKPGSTVIFHDYGWAEGVKRVVHEDVMPLVRSYDELPNMWWGTIGETA